MLNVVVENKYGDKLNLSSNKDYQLLQVTGLTPPNALINTSKIATKDGSQFNSSTLDNRNIVLTIAPRGNVESSRINLYKYIKSKQYIKLYLTNGTRKVWIEGHVESINGDLYENPQKLQVSIICPDPYFKAENEELVSFSVVTEMFTFPFSISSAGTEVSKTTIYSEQTIHNDSDDEVGIIVEIFANSEVSNPAIHNLTTDESFTIEYDMETGDKITLNTKRGEKSLTLNKNGIESNIINHMTRDSKWFTLATGDNIFSCTSSSGVEALKVVIKVQPIYEGV